MKATVRARVLPDRTDKVSITIDQDGIRTTVLRLTWQGALETAAELYTAAADVAARTDTSNDNFDHTAQAAREKAGRITPWR